MSQRSKLTPSTLREIDDSILGHINDPVSIVDRHYIYRAVSRAYEHMFQMPAVNITGQTVEEIHGAEVFNNILKPALDKTLSGEDFEFQFSRHNPDGNIIHIHSKHSVYHGPLTEGGGVAVVARDVTELVIATEALNKERRLLKNIINSLPDFIFAKDNEGVYQITNRSFEEFLNKSEDEILGKTDADLMSKESAAYIQKLDNQVLTTGKSLRMEEWATYSDGRRRLLDMQKIPLDGGPDEALGLLGVGTNVTFEKQAEQHREIISLLFEVTNNPCFILDANAEIIALNTAAQYKFNLTSEQNGSIQDHFFCVSGEKCDIRAFLGDKNYWNGEVCSKDNTPYVVSLHKVASPNDGSDRFVLIFQNREEQHALTTELLTKAYEDPLTNLPNRRLFFSKLENAIIRAERQLQKLAILYIDLNDFKPINDNLGHNIGDQVLIEVATLLSQCFRKTDTVARIGGDEFAALVDINSRAEAKIITDKIYQTIASLSLTKLLPNHKISASVGTSYFPDDAGTADELMNKADQAMYEAKKKIKSAISKSNT